MATATVDTSGIEHKSTVRDRVVETLREAARLPREAHLPKSVQEAVEDAVHSTTRAIKMGQRRVSDLKDEAIYRVKRQPLQVVGGAFGIGLALGLAVGWSASRVSTSRPGS